MSTQKYNLHCPKGHAVIWAYHEKNGPRQHFKPFIKGNAVTGAYLDTQGDDPKEPARVKGVNGGWIQVEGNAPRPDEDKEGAFCSICRQWQEPIK